MAKGEEYRERGIKEDVDYGTQFLNARAEDGEAPPPPPAAPTGPGDETPGGRGVGAVLMVVLIVGALAAGIAGFLLFGGGDDGSSGDLVTAGDVEIDENGFPVQETTTTTEAPRATTTSTSTTSTTLATTTTGATVPPETAPTTPPPPPPTQPPSCPGGTSQTTFTAPFATTGNNVYRFDLAGTTSNSTTAPFDLTLVVSIRHEVSAGNVKTMEVRTDQDGQSVPAGGSIDWTASVTVRSVTQPQPLGAGGAWRWSEPRYATCPTGTFG